MKKNDLIKMLQEIDGNPEIVIWNGYVDDYMNIEKGLTKITLVKETEQFLLEALVHEWCKRNNTFDIPEDQRTKIAEQAKKLHKKREYDFQNPHVTEDEFNHWYGKKKLTKYVLSPKLRGKTSLGVFNAADLNY
ncbi:Uncharacterised protein [Escherichia coli]|uniref:hypothetical protein n=1 Tax=Escherichia coli TaxID=562 RepID=UPI001A451B34|nr:hypothetical protein [Escherichia coli]EHV4444477.1 hypothetical protein [Escherichia coli]MDI1143978.1 hypothetical protein [Escherichia coli]VVZ30405.1 Uncharacterised protein [Escherichia coli]VVZ35189.1 Uncharacterised protein [Escherichia coli]VWN21049.1 Uncharacterised protein [Escherichia coli]